MLQLQSLSTHSSQSKSSQGILKTSSSKYDPQKRKVVKQQQQRLLSYSAMRASAGKGACKVKFCGQMISLWKHMKKCRDKDCKTAHCLSSRCVLNHYRICKSKNKTSTCEVCGPVMRQIKDNHPPDDDESTTNERDDTVTQGGLPRQDVPGQQPSQFEREGNNSSNLVRGGGDSQRIEDLQAAQLKIQQKQALLNQVQNQQVQLFEQQTQLEHQQQHVAPQTQKGQHLQQQQLLLQQLLIQFQQQEMLLRQEIMQLSHANQGSGRSESAR
ncbi:histone acetylation protein [Fragilaria crotonensis]|nr:histone acetylation protein [Fragilaria crotonensis]